MTSPLLACTDLTIAVEDKAILHNITLNVDAGSTHVLMGPNGAGKSTLGKAIMGDPEYTAVSGSIVFNGEDITEASPDKRSKAGLFMSFQAPVEVPGVPLFSYLRALVAAHPELELRGPAIKKRVAEIMDTLHMDKKYLDRELNVGFSGGEKKKVEMLQLLLLQPKLAILDETDSGLDVDALDTVSRAIRIYQQELGGTLLMITHNTRILEHLEVDAVDVMIKGQLVEQGCADLIGSIDKEGFKRFAEQAEQQQMQAQVEARIKAQPQPQGDTFAKNNDEAGA